MEDLSFHIFDIVENSLTAGATEIEICIVEDIPKDILTLTIKDNGRGMDREMLENVKDPFMTTRTTRRVGLGISLLEQSTLEADGYLDIISEPGKGTEIKALFKNSHIDRKPVGDIKATLVPLISLNPDINFIYKANYDGIDISIDTREIKTQLEGVSIANPEVIKLIKNLFET